ncbi:hypothetical protein SUNI508_11138 [Seiridium unicorne]|uniref:Uncharacterized protein n=1 Tax=Seiridium unicorne TaxID=138068 RepID=A0ABR2UIV5_9PEZI
MRGCYSGGGDWGADVSLTEGKADFNLTVNKEADLTSDACDTGFKNQIAGCDKHGGIPNAGDFTFQ